MDSLVRNKTKIQRIKQKQRLFNDVKAWIWLLPLVIALYLMVWRPTVIGVVWSFFKMKGYSPEGFIGFKNFIEVMSDTEFLPTMLNSLEYVVLSLIVGFVPPVIIAVMINEMVHFKNGFKLVTYLPALIPGVAVSLMWYYMYYPDSTGLLNMVLNALGLESYEWLMDGRFTILYIIISMTWNGAPATMLLYFSALQGINTELYEAAVIDGAGMFKKFWNVTLPQLGGVLLLNFVNQIIGVFQVMEQPMAMTGGGPNNASTTVGYQIYKYGFVGGRAGHALALSVITFVILMVMTAFYFKLEKKVSENY